MAEVFQILGREVTYSQERINFVSLKWEYQNLSYATKAKMLELFPDSEITTSGEAAVFSAVDSNPFMKEVACKTYTNINGYIEEREKYLQTILGILYQLTSDLGNLLKANKVYMSTDALLEIIFNNVHPKETLESVAQYIKDNSKPHVKSFTFVAVSTTKTYDGYYDKICQKIENEVLQSEDDSAGNGSTARLLVENIVAPFDRCFLAAYDSETYNVLFQRRTSTDATHTVEYTPVMNDKEIPASTGLCIKAIAEAKIFQEKLIDAVCDIVFLIFQAKMQLLSENGLCSYDSITNADVKRAAEIRKIVKEGGIPEEDEKELLLEMIVKDPFEPGDYFAILDKYYDPNGEVQRLAQTMGVNVLTHIENRLINIYNDGDISTYDSTLALKQKIVEEQAKYHLEESKAYSSVLYRQYFLELSQKAANMTEAEIISAYTSIKDGNNTFVEDKSGVIDDDSCILILTRRFRKINAAKYHDTIRQLGLTDDKGSDKCYAFYEEGENYLTFEEDCLKKIAADLTHDDDLAVQNYDDDKLASGEIILGYFQYTRALDFLTDGKCLVITNKRLYTLKEGFNDISNFIECKAVKKLLLTHLIIKMSDGKDIQLPVSKEIMDKAADMINRLVKTLKGETYNSITSSDAQTESAISSATSAIKQGLGSLFGKKNKTENTWNCSCGSVNKGAFCPKCGTKRP